MTLIHPVPGNIFKSSLNEAHKRARQVNAKNKRVAIKVRELSRVEFLSESIYAKTDAVVKKTVNFRELPDFQREMSASLVNLDELRRALHSLGWAGEKVMQLSREYRRKMRGKSDIGEITRLRKQFEKRTEDIMSKVENDAKIIRKASKTLRKMPALRKMKTVLIAGYPNVGKSSLLNALSDSKVDVQPYPFTTKSILVGYMKEGYRRIQLVDTPGILDRAPKNPIEKQAVTALRHLSEKLLFVFDPSETCGYSMKEQTQLLDRIKKEFNPELLIVYSKSDLKPVEQPQGLKVSAKNKESIDELRKKLLDWFPIERKKGRMLK